MPDQEQSKKLKIINISSLEAYVFSFFGYLILAVGGIGLGQDVEVFRVAIMPVWLLAFLLLLISIYSGYLKLPIELVIFYFLICCYLLIQVLRSHYYDIALVKIDGFIISGTLVYALWRYGLAKYGDVFIDKIIITTLFFLLLTVFYKFYAGFWDRGVRFFINGPNVYGWMLGLASVLSIYRYLESSNKLYLFPFLFFFSWYFMDSV